MSRKIIAHLQELLARERGAMVREWGHRRPVALVYPQEYQVGMGNLGFQTIYRLLNDHPDLVCERAFLPELELLAEYRRTDTPLLTLESQRPLTDFAAVAFSVAFEPDYLNVLRLLELARLPLLAADRGPGHPWVVAGGVGLMLNPEPLAPFLDAVFIGEGEEHAADFFARLTTPGTASRWEHLRQLAREIPGIYVPAAYQPVYRNDGTLGGVTIAPGFPARIQAPHPRDLEDYPTHSALLTQSGDFSRMFLLEVDRGCGRGCRFCAAGFVYRPFRLRSEAALLHQLEAAPPPPVKIGLVGTAVTDHPALLDLCHRLVARGYPLGLSSLRADQASEELFALLKQGGVKTIALAPEAGSERLRRVINKNLSEDQLREAVVALHRAGIANLRLYFMVGLPTETREEVEEIPRLVKRLQHAVVKASQGKSRLAGITLSLNCFVPKPFTPFQWVPFAGIPTLKDRIKVVKRLLQDQPGVRVHADLPKWAYIQALLSRGDRRVADLLLQAHKLDGDWGRACRESPVNPDFFVLRERSREEIFPWDIIDHGVSKDYLWEEYQLALAARQTPPCPATGCRRCGVCR